MKKHIILCLSLCTLLSSHPAHAWDGFENDPKSIPSIPELQERFKDQKIDCPTCGKIPDGFLKDWEKDKAFLHDLDIFESLANCDLEYNILWQWSKKGNLNARFLLSVHMLFSGFEGGGIFMIPATSWNVMTKKHYISILAVHQIGSKEESDEFKRSNQYLLDSFIINIDHLNQKSDFGKCMSKERSQKCVEQAVKNGIIPSFDRFAREIDALYAAGFMPMCASGGGDHHGGEGLQTSPE